SISPTEQCACRERPGAPRLCSAHCALHLQTALVHESCTGSVRVDSRARAGRHDVVEPGPLFSRISVTLARSPATMLRTVATVSRSESGIGMRSTYWVS